MGILIRLLQDGQNFLDRRTTKRRAQQEDDRYLIGYRQMMSMAVGKVDSQGETVANIYATNDDYVVYETQDINPSLSVKVCIYTKDPNNRSISPRYSRVNPYYMRAKSLLHKVDNTAAARARIGAILGYALANDNNVDDAIAMFQELTENINSEFNERIYNKLAFLFSNIILSTVFSLLSFWRYWEISHNKQYRPHHFDILTLIMWVLTCASIGGTFSLSIKLRSLTIARSVKWITYCMYGLERLFISISAGFIMFLAVSAKIIFTGLVSGRDELQNLTAILLLAVLAGFSETLVPDLLVSLEKNKEKQDKKEKASKEE